MIFRGFLAIALALLFLSGFKLKDDLKVTKIAAGPNFNCALFSNHKMKCWGDNSYGQLGIGTKASSVGSAHGSMSSLPYVLVGEEIGRADEEVIDFDVGSYHACALFKSGKMKCWGGNVSGELGAGIETKYVGYATEEMKSLPYVQIGKEIARDDEKIIKIQVGYQSACAWLESGKIKCWGANSSGALGIEVNNNVGRSAVEMQNLPYVKIGEEIGNKDDVVKDLFLKTYTPCALFTSGKAKCWGYNSYSHYGTESMVAAGNTEGLMAGLKYMKVGSEIGRDDEKIIKIESSSYISCVLFSSGRAKCFGQDYFGNLGLGLNNQQVGMAAGEMAKLPYIFVGEKEDERIADMDIGNYVSCVILQSKKVKCWGNNFFGELGLGDFRPYLGRAPADFQDLVNVYIGAEAGVPEDVPIQVTVGDNHACALFDNGKVQCWGRNTMGQLGIEDAIDRGKYKVDEEGMSPYVKF